MEQKEGTLNMLIYCASQICTSDVFSGFNLHKHPQMCDHVLDRNNIPVK